MGQEGAVSKRIYIKGMVGGPSLTSTLTSLRSSPMQGAGDADTPSKKSEDVSSFFADLLAK